MENYFLIIVTCLIIISSCTLSRIQSIFTIFVLVVDTSYVGTNNYIAFVSKM